MSLGSTQILIEMSTRNISWGKDGRCLRLTTLPPSCGKCLEIWERQLPGTLRFCPCQYRDCFILYLTFPLMKWKGCGHKRPFTKLKLLLWHFLERPLKLRKILRYIQDRQSMTSFVKPYYLNENQRLYSYATSIIQLSLYPIDDK